MSLGSTPDNIVAYVRDLEARIKKLELSPQNGLSRIQVAEVAGPDTYSLAVLDTWIDLSGGPGPIVTCTTGKKALVVGSAELALQNQNKNLGAKIGYAVSGATTIVPTSTSPSGKQYFTASAATSPYGTGNTVTFVDLVDLNPGDNVFTMKYRFEWSSGGGLAWSTFANMILVVIPVDV